MLQGENSTRLAISAGLLLLDLVAAAQGTSKHRDFHFDPVMAFPLQGVTLCDSVRSWTEPFWIGSSEWGQSDVTILSWTLPRGALAKETSTECVWKIETPGRRPEPGQAGRAGGVRNCKKAGFQTLNFQASHESSQVSQFGGLIRACTQPDSTISKFKLWNLSWPFESLKFKGRMVGWPVSNFKLSTFTLKLDSLKVQHLESSNLNLADCTCLFELLKLERSNFKLLELAKFQPLSFSNFQTVSLFRPSNFQMLKPPYQLFSNF